MTTAAIDVTPKILGPIAFVAGNVLQWPQYFPSTASNGTVTYLDPATIWSRVDLVVTRRFDSTPVLTLSTSGGSPAFTFGTAVVPINTVNTTVPALLWYILSAATAGIAPGKYQHRMAFTRISDGQVEYLFQGEVDVE